MVYQRTVAKTVPVLSCIHSNLIRLTLSFPLIRPWCSTLFSSHKHCAFLIVIDLTFCVNYEVCFQLSTGLHSFNHVRKAPGGVSLVLLECSRPSEKFEAGVAPSCLLV